MSKLVDVLWYFDTSDAPVSHERHQAKEKVLPTGTFEFVFNLVQDEIRIYEAGKTEAVELSGAIACGVHSQYFELGGERRGKVAGVHFRPAGAYPILQQSAEAFANRHVNLVEVLGTGVTDLRSELASLTGASSVLSALEDFLIASIDRRRTIALPVARALAMFEEDPFCDPMPAVQTELAITRKSLIEAFKRCVGLAPKTYARVVRFQEVLKQANSDEHFSWADTALRCGYYDQAHFGRDFRSFSGFSPGEYRARVGENRNHVPS